MVTVTKFSSRCANPYFGSDDFLGRVESTANNKLASCMDSAPLTVEGCQEGLRRAASYVGSQVALKGDRACGGFVNIAKAKGAEAGAITVSGTCMPDYSNIIISA
ncbi:uncharacterized protein BO88DRAFT_82971 [Aspergillus vadensis CBS 113365]|uniref:Uncharacterized protein n=1 Tax=Aspergillus vadensis (strain CBS 113365 / IMI 142717 / IBT 24658) TaxID=1448311 RepID=A0A319B2S3_ASPVC|nr:hypothetical protein BO88DRAFT_82971 [Aspergillus vadensis CBS 113365]PYH67036.1 hypothetical protein BO88DRAFT_82971 [Aspergillus vadensis CBS 113365]